MTESPDPASKRVRKSEAAFRTISEVAAELDVPQHVLRFWESKFSQVKPLKRGGGRRYYRPEDVSLLKRIRALLYDDGLTIKGVQKLFRDHGVKTVVDGLAMSEAKGIEVESATQDSACLGHIVAELRDLQEILRLGLARS